MRGGAPLLDTRAPLAIRRIVRALLNDLRRTRRRLEIKGDDEALHDFRVTLRRLRSTLRVYRPILGRATVPRKLRRRLKRFARTTSAARDAEVGLLWLQRHYKHLHGAERIACQRLIVDMKQHRDASYRKTRRALKKNFNTLDARLKDALRSRVKDTSVPNLASTVSRLLHTQVATVSTQLQHIASVSDTRNIHAARIEAKRLRYLLEPLAAELPGASALLKSLKCLQEEFGELCDRQMLSEELIAAAARYDAAHVTHELRSILGCADSAPAVRQDVATGLVALANRVIEERRQRFTEIERQYLGGAAQVFLEPYRALADDLARQPLQDLAKKPAPAERSHHPLPQAPATHAG